MDGISFDTIQTRYGKLRTMCITFNDSSTSYRVETNKPSGVVEVSPLRYESAYGTFHTGVTHHGELVAWPTIFGSGRCGFSTTRMHVTDSYKGDEVTQWVRLINGKAIKFSRIRWGNGDVTVRCWDVGGTVLLHEFRWMAGQWR